jgi:hypothetical protein
LDEKKGKEIKLCENNINIELNLESNLNLNLLISLFIEQNRRESEGKITKMIDERLFSLKLDLAKEKKVREESENKYYKTYGEQIGRL